MTRRVHEWAFAEKEKLVKGLTRAKDSELLYIGKHGDVLNTILQGTSPTAVLTKDQEPAIESHVRLIIRNRLRLDDEHGKDKPDFVLITSAAAHELALLAYLNSPKT
jgi:hypothetical protein